MGKGAAFCCGGLVFLSKLVTHGSNPSGCSSALSSERKVACLLLLSLREG